jgi:CRP/FNR family transcriptional regulator
MEVGSAPTWSELFRAQALGLSRTARDREVIARRGDPAEHAWFLPRGLLEVYQTGADGTGYLARILVAPTVLCLKECLAQEAAYMQTVRVLEEAELVLVPRARALAVLESHPRLCLNTLIEVSRAFCGAARLEVNRMDTTESLLAAVLLAYTSACGEPWDGGVRMRVKRTQTDLADAIGANERSVNRVLTAWKKAGIIDKRDARYVVSDRARLEALVEDGSPALVHHGQA